MGKPTKRQLEEFEKIRKLAKEMGLPDMHLEKKHATRTSKEQNDLFKKGKSKLDGYNKLSPHQQGLAVDAYFTGVKEDSKQIELLKKLKNEAKKRGTDYGQISWDMGHFKLPYPKDEIIKAKSSMFDSRVLDKYRESKMEIPEFLKKPSPVDEIADEVFNSVASKKKLKKKDIEKIQQVQALKQEEENVNAQEQEVAQIEEESTQQAQLEKGVQLSQTSEGKQILVNEIQKNPELNAYQKNHIEKIVSNPSKLANKITDVNNPDEKKSSTMDMFVEALTFMLPTAMGAGIGAMIEGGEGAVAGADYAQGLQKSFQSYKDNQEKLKMERERLDSSLKPKQKAIQQSGYIDKETGEPAIFDPNSGKYLTSSGREINSANLQEGVQKRFESKAGELSDKQVETLNSFDDVLSSIDRISELKENVDTGIVSDQVNSLLELVDKAPANYTELKAETNDSLAKYVKSISGAQVSEQEAIRLGRILPTTADNDETFKAKLKVLKTILSKNKNNMLNSIKRGQPLKKLEGLDEALKSIPSSGKEVESGIMSSAQRSRLEELRRKYNR